MPSRAFTRTAFCNYQMAASSASSSPSRSRRKKRETERRGKKKETRRRSRSTSPVKKERRRSRSASPVKKEVSKKSRRESREERSRSPRRGERQQERERRPNNRAAQARSRSASGGGQRPRGGGEKSAKEAPKFEASGLLDEESDGEAPLPAAAAAAARPPPVPLSRRSRSRDEPVARLQLDLGKGFDGKGDSKGFGKGGGKDDGKGKGKKGEKGPLLGPDGQPIEKEKPNFEASGLLAVEDNSKNGVILKFTAPAEARLPGVKWRLYIFTKNQTEKPKIVHIHRMTGILFGKDRRVVDVPTDHPTCSKQHAVLHYRLVSGQVRPYIMDLESINGTFLNGERLEHARYYEMRESDMLKFGMSTREYVLLHAGSANHMEIDPSKLRSDSEG